MINTSTIKQQQNLISILTTQLEKQKARLKELQSVETKISKTLETLLPILSEYPEYKNSIAEKLGLTLPPPTQPRVIEIIDGEETNHHQTIKKLQPENNPTPTITITEIITQLTSTFPDGWKYNKTNFTWQMALTETEVIRITQLTNKPTGTIELQERLYQWNLQETNGNLELTVLTLQQENNNDTTSNNNAETDSTHIKKSGDVLTLPTSDMGEISDAAPPTSDTTNTKIITWYDSSSGEIIIDNEHRYFKLLYDVKQNNYEIRLKKSETAKTWSKNTNSTTQKFIDAVWKNIKNHPSEKEKGGLKQQLHNTATEAGGKFCQYPNNNITSFGFFYIKDQKIAEVGYQNNSWWFIAPGKNQVYCSGNATTFVKVLKGLATEESRYSNKEEIAKIANTFNAKTENGNKPNKNQSDSNNCQKCGDTPTTPTSEKTDTINTRLKETNEKNTVEPTIKTSDCWYTPPEVIKPVIEVLEIINLDPCSDDGKHIPATTHYTKKDNGLACIWQGKVFLNPPYSCPSKWIEKLISEINDSRVTEAIALLPASTDTKWFEPLWSQPICFWKGRIKFLDTNYQPKSPARQSHCLVYWGENIEKFNEIFGEFGEIVLLKKDSPNIESEPKEQAEKTLTISQKIKPYLPPTWILEEKFFDKVIIKEKNHQNNHVELCNSIIGDIYIRHNQELLYTVNYQDIETAIDLIYSWFKTQKTVKNSNKNSINQIELAGEPEPKEKAEKTLTITISQKIKPYLPPTWILEEKFFDKVILRLKTDKNIHIKLIDCLNGDIYIKHNQELLYTVNYQDIETTIDLIYSWFEQQKTVTTPSMNPKKSNKNSSNKIELTGESEPKEKAEKILTLTEKITPLLLKNWVIKTVDNNKVLIYSSNQKNSEWVQITEIANKFTPFLISHGTEFLNNATDIKSALERANWWFESIDTTDYFEIFIKTINSYSTDLTIVKKDSSTAYIQIDKEILGTVFYKDNQILEIAEREKQILKELYSIDIETLIQDINNKEQGINEEKNDYLIGIDSLDTELNHQDTLQNALHSLSNQFNLVTIRQGKTFKIYNNQEWLEDYLGSIQVNDSKINSDEQLIYQLLNKYSILLNQLTTNID